MFNKTFILHIFQQKKNVIPEKQKLKTFNEEKYVYLHKIFVCKLSGALFRFRE